MNSLLSTSRVYDATTAAFFNTATLPATSVSQTILNNLVEAAGPLSKTDQNFFIYMRMAELGTSEESAVDDFAMFLLCWITIAMAEYFAPGKRCPSTWPVSALMPKPMLC